MKLRFAVFLILVLVLPAGAQDDDFTIEITFDRNSCTISLFEAGKTSKLDFDLNESRRTAREIKVRGKVLADAKSFHLAGRAIDWSDIQIARVSSQRDRYKITLERFREGSSRRSRRSADRVQAFQYYLIPEDEFIRGDVLVVGDDLSIEGEVNGDVVALFGDIELERSAICQRDVLAVGGRVKRHRDARVYGAVQGTDKWQRWKPERRRRYGQDDNIIDISGSLEYNRVDGLTGFAGVTFRSEEAFMPEFFAHYGYGFWSKRSKYRMGLRHSLFSYHRLEFGGEVYRLTQTEDEWICGRGENTFYTLIAREDFRDYHEGEGGRLFIEQSIGYDHSFRVDYKYEALDFMEANPNLWSLFGGDKKFRRNFSSVPQATVDEYRPDYSENEAIIGFRYKYSTVEGRHGELLRAGWYATIAGEHSSDDIGSDFDYDRYLIELRRYQPLTYRQNLNLRLMFGSATGDLPLHKLFYLGGIRTLRGFDIKEFYGSRVALANLEYVVDFSEIGLGLAALFDIGKTGWDSDFLEEEDWLADVGLGLIVFDDLRLELTRQLNSDYDDIQFSILIGRSF